MIVAFSRREFETFTYGLDTARPRVKGCFETVKKGFENTMCKHKEIYPPCRRPKNISTKVDLVLDTHI